MTFTLETGKRYRASVHLGFFEKLASNIVIMGKLVDAGFVTVTVSGFGADRTAEGTWSGDNQDVDLPEQIKSVQVIE